MKRSGTSSLLVAAYLPVPLLVRLTDAAQAVGAELRPAKDWGDLSEIARTAPVNLIVVDPFFGHNVQAVRVGGLLRQFSTTPLVAYTEFTPTSARTLTTLCRHGLSETVLYRYDDTPLHLQRIITRANVRIAVARLREKLTPEYERLPLDIAAALDDMFERPHAYASSGDLRLQSGRPKANLHRAIVNAGLGHPRNLFVAARALHAYIYLRDNDTTVASVARKLGYRSSHVMTRHTVSAFGLRPNRLRRVGAEDKILEQLALLIRRTSESDATA